MKTKNTLSKFITTIIAIIVTSNLLSCCKEKPSGTTDTTTYTTEVNVIILPNGICLVSENNDTITIVLEPISEITAHSGRASGNVTLIGESSGFNNLGYGIFWDTIQKTPTISSHNCVLKDFSEDFSFIMYNLQPSTKYYVGLFLTQTAENGTASSNSTICYRNFTTLDE